MGSGSGAGSGSASASWAKSSESKPWFGDGSSWHSFSGANAGAKCGDDGLLIIILADITDSESFTS